MCRKGLYVRLHFGSISEINLYLRLYFGSRLPIDRTELGRKSTVAWYRNPPRAARSALRIAYQDEREVWKSLQVDFVVASRMDDGEFAASIVDPHGDHLADAKSKLRALADFSDHFGGDFLRIESVAMTGDTLRALDLQDPLVRDAVRSFEGGRVTALYESDIARDYV